MNGNQGALTPTCLPTDPLCDQMTGSGCVRAGWLFDGSWGPIRRDVLLRFRVGRIESVTARANLSPLPPETVDFSGHTLLPGLIDSHVHLFMSASGDPVLRARQLGAPFAAIRPVIERHLRQHLACGVVAVRDGGDAQGHALRFKGLREPGGRIPVVLRVAGRAWHRTGRYGTLIGRSPGENEALADAVGRDREGGDHVKIVNSGLNSLVAFGRQTRPQFDLPELRAAVATAQSMNRPVMVHANGRQPVRMAVEAGCSSVEHGFFMGHDTLQRMADRGTVWVPTAATMQAYAEHHPGPGSERDVARRNLAHQLAQIQQARRLGVTVALGTDAGSLRGAARRRRRPGDGATAGRRVLPARGGPQRQPLRGTPAEPARSGPARARQGGHLRGRARSPRSAPRKPGARCGGGCVGAACPPRNGPLGRFRRWPRGLNPRNSRLFLRFNPCVRLELAPNCAFLNWTRHGGSMIG